MDIRHWASIKYCLTIRLNTLDDQYSNWDLTVWPCRKMRDKAASECCYTGEYADDFLQVWFSSFSLVLVRYSSYWSSSVISVKGHPSLDRQKLFSVGKLELTFLLTCKIQNNSLFEITLVRSVAYLYCTLPLGFQRHIGTREPNNSAIYIKLNAPIWSWHFVKRTYLHCWTISF